ncbi:poly [ADP-ribose] polymerase [Larkinella arboricola]|uniref:NAD(+) ADP-ribosyltransferase n=1 Tax=Larkinella arboricola TaxID=643671 RepID=A0A327XER7_LARAB|nr:ADP-ribose polymerase [Larkinella arboricola]RAK02726.1 poly [ADP-ribose] polymerase [Larkinella arboricola]
MLSNLIQQVAQLVAPATAPKTAPFPTNPPTPILDSSAKPVDVPTPKLRTVKLIMVTAENNNKYYEMHEQPDGTFTVHYGRVGGSKSVATYPMAQWDRKIREKVTKGYVDQTHMYVEGPAVTDASTIANPEVRGLMSRLMELANQSIFQNYVVTAQQVTHKQVETAQQLLNDLTTLVGLNADVTAYNQTLLELFKVIPRKMGKVGQHLLAQTPQTADDLQKLHDQLASEQDTLDVMRGQVELRQSQESPDQTPASLLEMMNLTVEPVTDKRVLTLIKRMMGSDADKFDAAFSVSQAHTQAAFEAHVGSSSTPKTQLLWHGSRSENWLSILKTGLVLRPTNAVITGKMFGYGIYFADQFSKSLNYTSLHGSVWANGKQREGYLGIYEVHVGKQMKVTRHEPQHMNLDQEALKRINPRYDSVFAQRGESLLKNEFIVYNQAQCTVRYMVRIKL